MIIHVDHFVDTVVDPVHFGLDQALKVSTISLFHLILLPRSLWISNGEPLIRMSSSIRILVPFQVKIQYSSWVFCPLYLTAQLLHKCSCFRIVVRLFHIFAFGHRINRFKQLLLEAFCICICQNHIFHFVFFVRFHQRKSHNVAPRPAPSEQSTSRNTFSVLKELRMDEIHKRYSSMDTWQRSDIWKNFQVRSQPYLHRLWLPDHRTGTAS